MQPARTRPPVVPSGRLPLRRAVALAAFFLSGAAGLAYEVVWIRRASLVFGSTTAAFSTVLAVFYLGLAVGSELFGRLSRRLSRPLVVVAALELGTAALALLSLPAFSLADALYGAVYRSSHAGAATSLATIALIALLLLPPTLLMGGTLPLFCRHFVRERGRITGSIGWLYALNTLGAAVGCLATGLVALPRIGMTGSIVAAAALDALAAALLLGARLAPDAEGEAEGAAGGAERARALRVVPVLFLVSGFAALGQEVVWARFLSLVIDIDAHTYTLTLAAALLGIVLGSLLAARLLRATRARARWFACLEIASALSVLAVIGLPPAAWARLDGSLWVILLVMLPPALLSGAVFPLAMRMVIDDPALAGSGVGRMTAMNTLGGILGSLAIGFLVLPQLGLAASVRVTTGASLLAGALAWLLLDRGPRLALRASAVAACFALWIALPIASGTRLPADFLAGGGELVDYREGLEANVAVIRRDESLDLEIDRWWQGSAGKAHQIMAAHVPALLHPHPRRVLLLGVGVGQTAERFLLYDVERLDCVDIEPAVFEVIRPHFGGEWMADPRVRLIRADGRNVVSHTDETYDVISLELGQISRPGVANFYSVDFYERARDRLAPGGVISQFVPVPFLPLPLLRSVVRSFIEVFPYSALWYNLSELILVGSREPLSLAPERLALLTGDPRLAEDLRFAHWGGPAHWLNRPEVFLGALLTGRSGLEAFAAGGELLRDDPPRLAYAAEPVDPERASRNDLDFVAAIRPYLATIPDAIGLEVSEATAAAAARERDQDLAEIATRAELRRLRTRSRSESPAVLLPLAEQAIAANPESVEARLAAAQLLLRMGRLDRSRAELAEAIPLAPDDPRAHRLLAMQLHRERRLAEAIPHYRMALELRPNAATHFNLGAALLESGAAEEARAEFEAALRLDPGLEAARRELARMGAP